MNSSAERSSRWGAAYLIVAWLAVQAASIGFPAFDAPPWALRIFILVALLGFPLALVMAWVFDATPEGLKFDASVTGSKRRLCWGGTAHGVGAGLVLPGPAGVPQGRIGQAIGQRCSGRRQNRSTLDRGAALRGHEPGDKDQEYFSDGLSEELLNLLAQLPQLRVIARTSSFSFKGKDVDVATIGRALNVAHVLEGSVRKSGNTLRITAQ
jgi:hypothetical protein